MTECRYFQRILTDIAITDDLLSLLHLWKQTLSYEKKPVKWKKNNEEPI